MCAANRPIVVGYDGTNPSAAAVAWAAHEAHREGCELKVVTVHEQVYGDWMAPASDELLEQSHVIAARGVDLALYAEPSVPTESLVLDGTPGQALTSESAGASLLVVGSRGRGGFHGLLLGSVAHQVAAHASAPVAIIKREPTERHGVVLVGVDASVPAQAAIEHAFRYAQHRNIPLIALHAWLPAYQDPSFTSYTIMEWHQEVREHQQALAEVLQPWRERFPTVTVHERLVADSPAPALIAASAETDLIVIGTRGRTALSEVALGSVTHTVLQRADCPVVVVGPHCRTISLEDVVRQATPEHDVAKAPQSTSH